LSRSSIRSHGNRHYGCFGDHEGIKADTYSCLVERRRPGKSDDPACVFRIVGTLPDNGTEFGDVPELSVEQVWRSKHSALGLTWADALLSAC
jgi:hypothetical protein